MKKIKLFAKSLSMVLISSALLASCSKESDPVTPVIPVDTLVVVVEPVVIKGYIGIWSAKNGNQKETATFNADSTFIDHMETYNSTSKKWDLIYDINGTFIVVGNKMTQTILKIGEAHYRTAYAPEPMDYYISGTSSFNSYIKNTGLENPHMTEITVVGNILSIGSDEDSNGVYTDYGETINYTKQ